MKRKYEDDRFSKKAEKACKELGLKMKYAVVYYLLRNDIYTIGDLLKVNKDYLINIKGMGKKSVEWIDKVLDYYGYSLS